MNRIKKIAESLDRKIDLKKFFRFGITGVINTAIDWGIFTVLSGSAVNLDPVISHAAGYTAATVNSFFMNKNWTFQKRKNYNKAETFKFIAVNLVSLSVSALGVYLLHDVAKLNKYLSKIIVAGITIIVNYFGNKIFVFNTDTEK